MREWTHCLSNNRKILIGMWWIVTVTAYGFRHDGVLCHLHTHNCVFSWLNTTYMDVITQRRTKREGQSSVKRSHEWSIKVNNCYILDRDFSFFELRMAEEYSLQYDWSKTIKRYYCGRSHASSLVMSIFMNICRAHTFMCIHYFFFLFFNAISIWYFSVHVHVLGHSLN